MTDFKLTQKVLNDAETMAEVESIVSSALRLKGSGGHRILNTLLTGFLQKPFEENPEVLNEIDKVAGFCEEIGRLLQVVNASHLE